MYNTLSILIKNKISTPLSPSFSYLWNIDPNLQFRLV